MSPPGPSDPHLSDEDLDTLNQRGIALASGGALEAARDVFREAQRLRPDSYKPHANLALVWRKLGRLEDAARALESALALAPENARLAARLGQTHLDRGAAEPAAEAALRAHSLAPTGEHALLAARALFACGRAEQALRFAREAPPSHGAAIEIGCLLLLDREAEAVARIAPAELNASAALELAGVALDRRALAAPGLLIAEARRAPLTPGQAALAEVLVAELARVCDRADEAVELAARVKDAELDRGALGRLHALWTALGRPGEASALTTRALIRFPGDSELLLRDGEAALSADRPDIAIQRFEQALAASPSPDARLALSKARAAAGEGRAALAELEALCLEEPLDPRPPYQAMSVALHIEPEAPLAMRSRLVALCDRFLVPPRMAAPRARSLDGDRKLTLGYVSADFHDHAVMRFAQGVLREHDRERFGIHCYSAGSRRDAVTRAIAALALDFHDIRGKAPDVVADQIAADGVDLLVDLSGHTADLLPIFARRPAPVQLTWLGFPATTGLPAMDVRISDWRADPPGCEAFVTERLERLPHAAWCFEEPRTIPIEPRDGQPVVFGSFSRATKLDDGLLASWGRILAAVKGSRLLLKGRGLSSARARARIIAAIEGAGASGSRVEFSGLLVDRAQHLAAWNQLDICLDTFPYAGTTTTCEALFMGLPVVTRAGESHVSRVGASLLAEVGLSDLVATDWAAYEALAVSLAADTARRAELRGSLRARLLASPLGSAPAFTRSLEALYRGAWQRYAASQAGDGSRK